MRGTLFFCAVVGYAIALPSGSYHQEYSYKASSSSFKNNELQHKTDDQGYYKKDGDLEGRTRPRVDANSEHSEYVNPNLRSGNQYESGANTDMNSYGLMHASSGVDSYGTNQFAEGIASSDRIVGSRGYLGSSGYNANYGSANYGASNYGSGTYGSSSYGSGTYGSDIYGTGTYGSSGYTGSYGSTTSIQSIVQRLQQDFERDLQNYKWREGYSQAAINQAELERQLRRNLTERLNSELLNRYGQQTIKNGMSYSIVEGRTQSAANYNNQELANLKQQLENNLLNTLRTQYNQGYYGSSAGSSSHYESQSKSRYGYTSSTVRPVYQTIYPSLPVYSTTQRSTYTTESRSNYEMISSNVRYTPIVNPESISTIASSVQSQLDNSLNRLLEDVYRKYFSSSTAYQLTNSDVVLNRMQNELRNNITYLLEENLRRNYGSQTQRDGYLYSIGPNGQISTNYNYAMRDLEALKAQVERNLIEKLNREFNTYKTRYSSQSYSSQSSYNSYDQYSTTPRYYYTTYTTPRSQYISGGLQDYSGRSYGSGYSSSSYGSGSSYSSGTYGSTGISQLQGQLQDELSRQLQAAIRRDFSSYSSSGSYSPQNYQSSLQHLTDELNRNVTRHLQEFSASASYSASGNYDQTQIENLRSQLLSSLTRQLQQNLQQQLQSSSNSYSSSSSSNYRPVRGFQNYVQGGQYRSGGSVMIAGEECDHGNSIGYRQKRSPFKPYRNQQVSYYHSHNHNPVYRTPQQPSNGETGQEIYDITQQEERGQEIEEVDVSPSQSLLPKPQKIQEGHGQDDFEELYVGQETQPVDEGQQIVEEVIGNLNIGQQNEMGQHIDDNELTQQLMVEHQSFGEELGQQTEEFDNLQVGQQIDEAGQEPENLDFSEVKPIVPVQFQPKREQVASLGYESPKTQNVAQQQFDNSDLTQQTVEFNPLQTGQQVDNTNLSPVQNSQRVSANTATENSLRPLTPQLAYGQGSIPRRTDPIQIGQNNYDLTQQSEHFEPLQTGQQVDNTDLSTIQDTQRGYPSSSAQNLLPSVPSQSRQDHRSRPEIPKPIQFGQQIDNSDLSQQTEEFEELPVGQEVDNTDVTYNKPVYIQSIPFQQSPGVNTAGFNNYISQERQNPQVPYSVYQVKPVSYQPFPGFNGYNRPYEVGQQLENLSQQHGDFKPLQTGQNVDNSRVPYIQSGRTYSPQLGQHVYQRWTPGNIYSFPYPQNSITRNKIPVNPQSTTEAATHIRGHRYWNSHQWKPNQEIFIRAIRKTLIKKLDEHFENEKISNSDKESILKEISSNITKEINSYKRSYLMEFLEMTDKDIEGVNEILSEDLRNHYEEKIRYANQLPIDQLVGNSKNKIPEKEIQNVEQDVSSISNISSTNQGNADSQGSLIDDVANGYIGTENDYAKFTKKEQRIIKYIENSLVRDLDKNQYQNFDSEQINKELAQKIQNELSYWVFKRTDLSEIQSTMLQHLRNKLQNTKYFLPNNENQSAGQTMIESTNDLQLQQNVEIPTQNIYVETKPKIQQTLIGDQQNPIQSTNNFQSQQNVEIPTRNLYLEPKSEIQNVEIPTRNIYVESMPEIQQTLIGEQQNPIIIDGRDSRFDSTYYSSQLSSGSGSSYQQPDRKPGKLPDSISFINREIDHQRNNGQSGINFSSTLDKVLAEEQVPVIQNQPGRIPQQSVNSLSNGRGTVPLSKATVTWYGLPNEYQLSSQKSLADVEKLTDEVKQKDTKPIAQVVGQNQQQYPSNLKSNDNIGYDPVQRPVTTNPTNYNSLDSNLLFSQHGDDFYEQRINSNQQVQPRSSPNHQEHNFNSANSDSLFSHHGDDFYEGKLHYGNQNVAQENFETTGNIEPLEFGQANLVEPRKPLNPSNTDLGVKGRRQHNFNSGELVNQSPGLIPLSSTTSQPDLGVELIENSTPVVNQESLPWYKRFGNSVKQGVSDLKKKIVG